MCAQGKKSSMGPATWAEPGIQTSSSPGVIWDALVFRCPIGSHGIHCLLIEWLQLGVLAGNDVVL